MSSSKRHSDFLRVWAKHGKNRKDLAKLVDLASKDEIDACCEIYLNALKGRIRLKPTLLKKLAKHKSQCLALIDKKTTVGKKKKLLKGQLGGFLFPLLASIAGPLLGGVVKSITGRG